MQVDWGRAHRQLDEDGHAVIDGLLDVPTCRTLAAYYDDSQVAFRATIDMQRHNFGQGQYRYFDYPLPGVVDTLRQSLYPGLAAIANDWSEQLGVEHRWPLTLPGLLEECHHAGQRRPTPLLLDYHAGDYNCLHQDLYGPLHFPLQVIVMLSAPGDDFDGGELVLVEQRPRMQSRPMVMSLQQGSAAIIPVRERPRRGARGYHRVQLRHGVSRIERGRRQTLGLIFHDAS